MINNEMIRAHIDTIKSGKHFATTEECAAESIDMYLQLQDAIATLKAMQDETKEIINEILQETGQNKIATDAGTATITKGSTSTRIDAKIAKEIMDSDPLIARKMQPAIKSTTRKPSLRIKGK